MACWFLYKMLTKTDVEKSTLDQKRGIWLATLESYQHRFHVAREDVTAEFHRQQQILDHELHNDFCFINQKRLDRDVASLFDRYQAEIRALRRADIEKEYAHSLNHLNREEQEVIHQHQSMFPLPTISVARVPDETRFRPTSASPATALARTAMVTSPAGTRPWPTQTQVPLPHNARFGEESYRQRHILPTRHPANNAEFALRSARALDNTIPRAHADFHSYEALAASRLQHDKASGHIGHALGSWDTEVYGRSERRIAQFPASEARHNSSPDHARSSQTGRHGQLTRIDGPSDRQAGGETEATVSNNGYCQAAKSRNEIIEFDEVYQDGKAEFKHTIVTFSNKFYILKCDKYGVHFRQNALIAAAKNLNSALHGFLKKDFRQAIEFLGIRVVNCTDALAKLKNDCVRHAFAMGYKPMNLLRSQYDPRSCHETPTPPPERGLSLPTVSQQTPEQEHVLEDVTNPKPGELYWANCPETNKASVVMALGWKDLSMCGRDEMFCDLNLHKDTPRPRCYEFDKEGIIGWAAGYGDGESLVSSREVPVMRCESNGEDSFMWTSVRLLTPFCFNDPDRRFGADAGELRTVQVYARIRGFDSFESMLAYQAIKRNPRQEYSRTLTKSHRIGGNFGSEMQSNESHSLQPCDFGTEVLADDAATEMRRAPSTDSKDFGNVQDTLRSTVESACPSLSHTPNIHNPDLVSHGIRPEESAATPTPLNVERQNQPEKVQTSNSSTLPNARAKPASNNAGVSVASFLEQLRPGQNRGEGIRTCTPHAEHHADTIEVLLSPPNGSSHQQTRLEVNQEHTVSTLARHRRQSQRAMVRELRSRLVSTDSHTSATQRKQQT